MNSTVTVISTVQNQLVSFSTTKLNILLIVGIAAQGIGIYAFWLIQKRFKLSTLTMFKAVVVFLIILQLWGFVGIFQDRFGFHREYEAYMVSLFSKIGAHIHLDLDLTSTLCCDSTKLITDCSSAPGTPTRKR